VPRLNPVRRLPWMLVLQGAIAANQLVVEAAGALWFPLLDSGEVLKVEIPDS